MLKGSKYGVLSSKLFFGSGEVHFQVDANKSLHDLMKNNLIFDCSEDIFHYEKKNEEPQCSTSPFASKLRWNWCIVRRVWEWRGEQNWHLMQSDLEGAPIGYITDKEKLSHWVDISREKSLQNQQISGLVYSKILHDIIISKPTGSYNMHLASSLDDFMINYENKCQTFFEFFSLDQTGPPFFFFLFTLPSSNVPCTEFCFLRVLAL